MPKSFSVGKDTSKYKVVISKNSLSKKNLDPVINKSNKVMIVTDSGIPKKYLKELRSILKNKTLYIHILEKGENSKSSLNFFKIHGKLSDLKFDRTDCLLALGGGMVGDITGFCAATYLRGIPYIQIPTTLLSQVDSSVGGKTAINIKQGKNLVGAFNNPALVLISTNYLSTLPKKEFKSGLGEIVKYAFIKNKKLYKLLELNGNKVLKKEPKILEEIITESIKTKAKIVTEDEKEQGIRAILNFGHTFGHAIEAYEKYKGITHGEAITLGMVIALRISLLEKHISNTKFSKFVSLIKSLQLNTNFKKYKYSKLKKFLMNDKKVADGELNLVLINKSGYAFKTNKFKTDNLIKAFD